MISAPSVEAAMLPPFSLLPLLLCPGASLHFVQSLAISSASESKDLLFCRMELVEAAAVAQQSLTSLGALHGAYWLALL